LNRWLALRSIIRNYPLSFHLFLVVILFFEEKRNVANCHGGILDWGFGIADCGFPTANNHEP
jgi:hypothetical protein